MAKVPPVLWAQRDSFVTLSIALDNPKVDDLSLTSTSLHFKGSNSTGDYELTLEFFAEVEEPLKKFEGTRYLEVCIPKKEHKYWPRLLKTTTKMHWLKVDFARWKDEDDEEDDEAGVGGGFNAPGGFDMNDYLSSMSGGQEPNLDFMGEDDDNLDDMPELEGSDDEGEKGEKKDASKDKENKE